MGCYLGMPVMSAIVSQTMVSSNTTCSKKRHPHP